MTKPVPKLSPDQLRLLDAIYSETGPLNAAQIHELVGKTGTVLTKQHIIEILFDLEKEKLVERHDWARGACWEITSLGKVRVCANDARRTWNDRVPTEPIKEAVHAAAHRTEAGSILHEQLRGSHAHLDNQAAAAGSEVPLSVSICDRVEPRTPATALICLDEDELDDRWNSLDVDLKADAFAQFTLHMHDGCESRIYVERNERIPLAGTIGGEARAAS